MNSRDLKTLGIVVALTMWATSASAGAATLAEPSRAALLVAKILSYDRSIEVHEGASGDPDLDVAVVHDGSPRGRHAALAVRSALSTKAVRIKGRSLTPRLVDVSGDDGRIHRALGALAPGTVVVLSHVDDDVSEIVAARKLRTFSLDPAALRTGAAVSFVSRGTRIAMVVRLANAQKQGMRLEARLLRMATLVKE